MRLRLYIHSRAYLRVGRSGVRSGPENDDIASSSELRAAYCGQAVRHKGAPLTRVTRMFFGCRYNYCTQSISTTIHITMNLFFSLFYFKNEIVHGSRSYNECDSCFCFVLIPYMYLLISQRTGYRCAVMSHTHKKAL